MKSTLIIPRVIRFRDAPNYLGMDRSRFNAEVRPLVPEFRIGRQGIGFDRLDLDAGSTIISPATNVPPPMLKEISYGT